MGYENVFDEIVEGIKKHEGFRGYQYRDHLGFETVGYGTKMPLTEEEAELLLRHRLEKMVQELQLAKPFVDSLPLTAKKIILDMTYQLGVPRLLGFRKMWAALERGDFKNAAVEMRDSAWNQQTPARSNTLASIMETVSYNGVHYA